MTPIIDELRTLSARRSASDALRRLHGEVPSLSASEIVNRVNDLSAATHAAESAGASEAEALARHAEEAAIAAADSAQDVEETAAALEEHGIEHTLHITEGAHSWDVWRAYLLELAPLLFK